MVMNVKRFKSILGGVVKTSIETGSPVAREVVDVVTHRISGYKDQENLDPSVEIARLIDSVVACYQANEVVNQANAALALDKPVDKVFLQSGDSATELEVRAG